MKRIVLSRGVKCWIADFEGDEKIKELFGTTKIPTAFSSLMKADFVLAAIREVNSDREVVLA